MTVVLASGAVEQLVERLDAAECRPRRSGAGWTALCPAHEDRSPSLSVTEGNDGRALVHCFRGCEVDAVLAGLGLRLPDLFERQPENPPPIRQAAERTYVPLGPLPSAEVLVAYERRLEATASAHELAWTAKRWTPAALFALDVGWDGERFTLPIRDRRGELVNVCRYLPGGRPKMLAAKGRPRELFPAPEQVRDALESAGVDEQPVYVVEGEPDAISAVCVGLPAVAIPGSRGWRPDWAARFAGLDVRVLTDHDDPGRQLAERVAEDLADYAAGLRVLAWPAILDREPAGGYDLGAWLLEHGVERSAA